MRESEAAFSFMNCTRRCRKARNKLEDAEPLSFKNVKKNCCQSLYDFATPFYMYIVKANFILTMLCAI